MQITLPVQEYAAPKNIGGKNKARQRCWKDGVTATFGSEGVGTETS